MADSVEAHIDNVDKLATRISNIADVNNDIPDRIVKELAAQIRIELNAMLKIIRRDRQA